MYTTPSPTRYLPLPAKEDSKGLEKPARIHGWEHTTDTGKIWAASKREYFWEFGAMIKTFLQILSKHTFPRLSHWHPISTVPCNQDVELRVVKGRKVSTLEFPCCRTNQGDWINVDLGVLLQIEPVAWRVWQHSKSPRPHHSIAQINDKSALLNTHQRSPERHSD
jgi:hypothetical protein